jgi:hypothetical protein
MTKRTKALVFQLTCFTILFIPMRFAIEMYTGIEGIWVSLIAFVGATFVSPKFQVVNTKDGEKLFVKWLFIKEVKEIK